MLHLISNAINSDGKVIFLSLMCIHDNGPVRVSKGFKYDTSSYNFIGYLHLSALAGGFAIFCIHPPQHFGSHFRMPH